jgi:DNA-binding SARP family transcriptional activator
MAMLAAPSREVGVVDTATTTRIHLLGGFHVTLDGEDVDVPGCAEKLVAFIALQDREVERSYVASSLWMEKSESRAQANLRSCLWRLRRVPVPLVATVGTKVRLARGVLVDLHEVTVHARQLIEPQRALAVSDIDPHLLRLELLPDWYDDFVEVRREHLRQMRLHALEAMAARCAKIGATTGAIDLALTVVAADPLRESAHRLVVRLHLDEGNIAEALRHYRLARRLMHEELGIEPTSELRALVAPWLSRSASGAA